MTSMPESRYFPDGAIQPPSTVPSSAGPQGTNRALAWALALVALGCVLAIAVPNLTTSLHRGAQKRTMGDMRTIATSMESYSIAFDAYPVTGGEVPSEAVAPLLEPTYVKELPLVDGWGTPYRIVSSAAEYSVTSLGADARPDSETGSKASPSGTTTTFTADIVFSTGSFVQYPEGTMN